MPAKRFDQAKPFLVLGLLVAGWVILPAVIKRATRLTFFEFQAPITVSASAVHDLQEFWSLRTRSNRELIEAGQQLARLNSSYEVTIQKNAALEGEISRLEELLNLPANEDYRAEPARVALRDFNAWWQTLEIRKGKAHGITEGAPVIFVGGVVGRVTVVKAYTSTVELISSPGVRLSAMIEGDSRPINYQGGENPAFGAARGTVEFVPLDLFANSTVPKRLLTSGLGGVYPAGLNIGQVVKLEPDANGLFKSGEVMLDPRLIEVSEVTVLVPLKSP